MKMNAWEWQLEKRIAASRAREIGKIIRSCRYDVCCCVLYVMNCGPPILILHTSLYVVYFRYKALNESLYFFSSLVVSVLIFIVHLFTGGVLTPGNVFSTLALVNLLQYTMTKLFPFAIMVRRKQHLRIVLSHLGESCMSVVGLAAIAIAMPISFVLLARTLHDGPYSMIGVVSLPFS